MTYLPSHIKLKRIVVNQDNVTTTLGGTIDSTKEYFIDGIVDIAGVGIEVPSGGINIKGFDFDVSQIVCSDVGTTLFTSPVGGSGNVLLADFAIEVSGAGSQVWDIVGDTGIEAIEMLRINYNNCTSLGSLDNYRQGLETGTGRFGGSPSLELIGAWVGGFRITTSIVRSLAAGMTTPLFKAGLAFVMQSRFLSDINCDLPTSAALFDFAPVNFPNPSTLQMQGSIISRNGVINSGDSNLTPNISRADLPSNWSNNIGLRNTFEGGRLLVSSEALTTVAAGSTWYTLNAIWTAGNLEHFDSPAVGQLRHLGNSPQEFKCIINFVIESIADNEIGIRLRKWDNSTSSFIEFNERVRQVNNLTGGRDVAIFNFSFNVNLDQNDYVYFQVRNNNGNNDLTLELNSDYTIEER